VGWTLAGTVHRVDLAALKGETAMSSNCLVLAFGARFEGEISIRPGVDLPEQEKFFGNYSLDSLLRGAGIKTEKGSV
jgi:hypothetical protein